MPELEKSLGWRYIQDTKFDREKLSSYKRLIIKPIPLFKVYKDVEIVKFPKLIDIKESLSKTIKTRRSYREYGDEPISMQELATILYHSYGIREDSTDFPYRNVPSAGALYPLEIYVYANKVEGLKQGIYHYNIVDNGLELLTLGDFNDYLVKSCLGQRFVTQGGCVIFFTTLFRRNMCKYGHRGLRYILLDAGHIAQNLILCSEALGIGTCPIGAFFDNEINSLLGVDGMEETTLYLIVMGKKPK